MTEHQIHPPLDDAGTSVLQALDLPVALADAETGTILVENARFFLAFPSTGEVPETLATRLPFLQPETFRERLAAGRTPTIETEVEGGPGPRVGPRSPPDRARRAAGLAAPGTRPDQAAGGRVPARFLFGAGREERAN